jgi:hypothetical protein
MQLRVARLCLDCEELHADNSCPHCASERYAFLSAWLPSDERRRWRQPAPAESSIGEPWLSQGLAMIVRSLGRWLSRAEPEKVQIGPATRASDHVLRLKFDEPIKEPATRGPVVPARKSL